CDFFNGLRWGNFVLSFGSRSLNFGTQFCQPDGVAGSSLELGQGSPCLLGHAVGEIEANLVDSFVGDVGGWDFVAAGCVADVDRRRFGGGVGVDCDRVFPLGGKVNLGVSRRFFGDRFGGG